MLARGCSFGAHCSSSVFKNPRTVPWRSVIEACRDRLQIEPFRTIFVASAWLFAGVQLSGGPFLCVFKYFASEHLRQALSNIAEDRLKVRCRRDDYCTVTESPHDGLVDFIQGFRYSFQFGMACKLNVAILPRQTLQGRLGGCHPFVPLGRPCPAHLVCLSFSS